MDTPSPPPSPIDDDLNNFPKYLKAQVESVKKYIREEGVKKDIYLVIPSNTAGVVKDNHVNMGDYNVYTVTVDSLEPIICVTSAKSGLI